MRARKCDRCGRFYEQYVRDNKKCGLIFKKCKFNKIVCVHAAIEYGNEIETQLRADEDIVSEWDLCRDCADKLYNWLHEMD